MGSRPVTFVGAGIGYRRAHHAELMAQDGQGEYPDLLELIPAHFIGNPEAAAHLAERYPLVLHEVGLSIGTSRDGALSRDLLRRIRELARITRPLLFSDHLAMTRSPSGVDLGHLAPIWYTEEMLAHVSDRVREWQDCLGMPVALENIAAPFVIPEADMTEGEFFTRLVDATGCAMLLDVTNMLANGRNFGFEPAGRLFDYPLSAVRQVHLAGGVVVDGFFVDSHSEPVESASFALLEKLRGHAPLVAIVVERDEKLPALHDLMLEVKRATAVWDGNV